MKMKKLSWIWMLVLIALVAGCGGGDTPDEPSPGAKTVEAGASPAATMPAVVEILPTSTPKPPPPTPTHTPVPPTLTPEPTATPVPTSTPAPTNTPVPTVEGETPVPTEVPPTPTPVPPTDTPTPIPPTPTPQKVEAPMIVIPAGEFTMGSDNKIERPSHTVSVEAFEIDQFEVTNEQFEKFVAETGYVTGAEQAGDTSWRYWANDKANHPVVKVTWNDAQAFCEWAEKRLPTEVEWEKAARGTDGRTYPWGNEELNDARANTKESGYRGTTIVGSFPAGGSPYGVMDMAGNVAEWTSDWFQPYPGYPGGDGEAQYFGEKFRVIRGGGWFDQDLVRTAARSSSGVELANDDVGFRCAK